MARIYANKFGRPRRASIYAPPHWNNTNAFDYHVVFLDGGKTRGDAELKCYQLADRVAFIIHNYMAVPEQGLSVEFSINGTPSSIEPYRDESNQLQDLDLSSVSRRFEGQEDGSRRTTSSLRGKGVPPARAARPTPLA